MVNNGEIEPITSLILRLLSFHSIYYLLQCYRVPNDIRYKRKWIYRMHRCTSLIFLLYRIDLFFLLLLTLPLTCGDCSATLISLSRNSRDNTCTWDPKRIVAQSRSQRDSFWAPKGSFFSLSSYKRTQP